MLFWREKKFKLERLTIFEITYITVISAALGVIWWGYSFLYNLIAPLARSVLLDGLLSGVWFIGATFFAYIIRKPGAAMLGELVASLIEGFISSWGIGALVFGFAQAILPEILFLFLGYSNWSLGYMSLAAALSSFGGFALALVWYKYYLLSTSAIILKLVSDIVSGIIFAGFFTVWIAKRLLKAGVLNQFKIARDKITTNDS